MHLFRGGRWGKAALFFVMENDVPKLIIILSPVALVVLVSIESKGSHGHC